jgi:hypothetical protein
MGESHKQSPGQLVLVCEQCDGQRIVKSDDTPAEVCDFCDGTGIDPDAAFDAVVVRGFWREARWTDAGSATARLRVGDWAPGPLSPRAPGR